MGYNRYFQGEPLQYRSREIPFDRQMEILRHKFRKDAGALELVSGYQAAIETIDGWFLSSGLTANEQLRKLIRRVFQECQGDLQRRVLNALHARYRREMDVRLFVINLQKARQRSRAAEHEKSNG
jgi:hypothetical protein